MAPKPWVTVTNRQQRRRVQRQQGLPVGTGQVRLPVGGGVCESVWCAPWGLNVARRASRPGVSCRRLPLCPAGGPGLGTWTLRCIPGWCRPDRGQTRPHPCSAPGRSTLDPAREDLAARCGDGQLDHPAGVGDLGTEPERGPQRDVVAAEVVVGAGGQADAAGDAQHRVAVQPPSDPRRGVSVERVPAAVSYAQRCAGIHRPAAQAAANSDQPVAGSDQPPSFTHWPWVSASAWLCYSTGHRGVRRFERRGDAPHRGHPDGAGRCRRDRRGRGPRRRLPRKYYNRFHKSGRLTCLR